MTKGTLARGTPLEAGRKLGEGREVSPQAETWALLQVHPISQICDILDILVKIKVIDFYLTERSLFPLILINAYLSAPPARDGVPVDIIGSS